MLRNPMLSVGVRLQLACWHLTWRVCLEIVRTIYVESDDGFSQWVLKLAHR